MTPQRFASGRFGGVARLPGHQVGRMISNLFGGGSAQELLDSAPFCSELLYTAIPQRAASGTTGTFTRATTSTWQNNDGYMVTGVAGEIGFPGARRVRNLIATNSEDATTDSPLTSNASATATVITTTAAGNSYYYKLVSTTIPAGGKAIFQCRLTAGTKTSVNVTIQPASAAITKVSEDFALTAVPRDVSIVFTNTAAVAQAFYIGFDSRASEGADATSQLAGTFGVTRWMLEDVTAQTTQTAGEYVSVGVPSDWAGDELVTNGTFDSGTDWTTDANITIGGGVMTCTLSGTSVGTSFSVVAGTKYVVSWDCTRYVAGANRVLVRKADTTVIGDQNVTGVTATGRYIREFTSDFTGTVQPQVEFPINGESDVDNVVIKPAYYHGSFVDGVKCFPTDLSGNPIPSTTMLGYQAQGARTNIHRASGDLTNATYWAPANATVTNGGATASDGATTMGKVTATAAGNRIESVGNSVSGSSAYTASIEMRAGSSNYGGIVFIGTGGAPTSCGAIFNLQTGAVVSTTGTGSPSASIALLANGNYRCSLTATTGVGQTGLVIGPGVSDGSTYTASYYPSATSGFIYASFVQLELGSFASSYIATTTIAVARNADVLTYSSAGNVSGTVGWCYAEIAGVNTPSGSRFIDLGTNRPALYVSASTAWSIYDGVTEAQSPVFTASGSVQKGTSTWPSSTNKFRCAANGALGTEANFDGNMDVGTTISIGCSYAGASQSFGTIRNVRIGQRALSSSEQQAITS